MSELFGQNLKQVSLQMFKPKVNRLKRRRIGEKGESESESYEPDFHQIKKYGLPIKENRVSSGSWTLEENKLYLKFMEDNRLDFETEKNRRRTKVFYRLSKVLKKRTPDQCRSHHQKLQIKYNDELSRILSAVRQKIAEEMGVELSEEFNTKACWGSKKTQATAQVNEDEYSLVVTIEVDFQQLAKW